MIKKYALIMLAMLFLSNQGTICNEWHQHIKFVLGGIGGLAFLMITAAWYEDGQIPDKNDFTSAIGVSTITVSAFYGSCLFLNSADKMVKQKIKKVSDCAILWDKSLVDLDNLQNCINGKEYRLTAEPSYEDDTN